MHQILQQTDFRVCFLLSHNKIFYVLNAHVVHSGYDCSRLKFAASFLKTLSHGLSGIQYGGHKAARDWGTGRSVPSPQLSWGAFVTWSAHVLLARKQKLKIIFNFQFLDSVENRKTKPCHRLQHCRRNKIAAHFHFSLHC